MLINARLSAKRINIDQVCHVMWVWQTFHPSWATSSVACFPTRHSDPTKGKWKGLVPRSPLHLNIFSQDLLNLTTLAILDHSRTFNLRHNQQLQQCKVWLADIFSMAHETTWDFTTQGFLTAGNGPDSLTFALTSRSHRTEPWVESWAEVPRRYSFAVESELVF